MFVIKGQNIENRNKILRAYALRAFNEVIELRISVDAFLNIGINAIVDSENAANRWYEIVHGFYSQIYPATTMQDNPHAKLRFVVQKNNDGLEYGQFVLFCKDAGNPNYRDP